MSSYRSLRRSLAAGLGLALVAPLAIPSAAGGAPAPDPVVTDARAWLLTQQQADGGFEVVGFPGFETPDATLALAQVTQTGVAWDKAATRTAIQALDNGSGKDPLDALDDLVESGDLSTIQSAVSSAKVTAFVAGPLGLDPTDFDPSNDSASPVNLVAQINSHVDDGTLEFGTFFNGLLFTAIGFTETGQALPANLATQITGGQRPDGSWNYAGTQDEEVSGDVDTTAAALIALHLLGYGNETTPVHDGLTFLAEQQQANGAWQAFGTNDPNSTSMGVLALSALHVDPTDGGWRSAFMESPALVGSPVAWLRSQQADDGHISSANDAFPPVNTFATSQSVEALSRQWFLAGEHELWSEQVAEDLGSPQAAPNQGGAQAVSDELGPNVAIIDRRHGSAGALLSSTRGREAAVADLFQQALGRTVDASGRGYWGRKLATLTRPQVLARLTGSSEFFRKHGSTAGGFVDAVYQAVLGRAADAGGRDYWIRKIQAGEPVLRVAQRLTASSEFKRREVRLAYQQVLGRVPTGGELTAGLSLVAGNRVEELLAVLASGSEYLDKVTSPPDA